MHIPHQPSYLNAGFVFLSMKHRNKGQRILANAVFFNAHLCSIVNSIQVYLSFILKTITKALVTPQGTYLVSNLSIYICNY